MSEEIQVAQGDVETLINRQTARDVSDDDVSRGVLVQPIGGVIELWRGRNLGSGLRYEPNEVYHIIPRGEEIYIKAVTSDVTVRWQRNNFSISFFPRRKTNDQNEAAALRGEDGEVSTAGQTANTGQTTDALSVADPGEENVIRVVDEVGVELNGSDLTANASNPWEVRWAMITEDESNNQVRKTSGGNIYNPLIQPTTPHPIPAGGDTRIVIENFGSGGIGYAGEISYRDVEVFG